MRILSTRPSVGEEAAVTMIAYDAEDMWNAYNLISKGDELRAKTTRKVPGFADRKVVTLTIRVLELEFDAEGASLRVRGVVSIENEWVKMGSHHSIELIPDATGGQGVKFSVRKQRWSALDLRRLASSSSAASKIEAVGVVLSATEALICTMTASLTMQRAHIESHVPRKRPGNEEDRNKAMEVYYGRILSVLERQVELDRASIVLLAGPGHWKKELAVRIGRSETLGASVGKVVEVDAPTVSRAALTEAMQTPAVVARLGDSGGSTDAAIMSEWRELWRRDAGLTAYGYRQVKYAIQAGAVQTLLISDRLANSADIPTRRAYAKLDEEASKLGARVQIVSSAHPAGMELATVTGVAAILRTPMRDIVYLIDAEEEATANAKKEAIEASSSDPAAASGGGASLEPESSRVLELNASGEEARGIADDATSTTSSKSSSDRDEEDAWPF